MKASIILADHVSHHPDGTFSLLRGGLDNVLVPEGRPCAFQGGIAVRFVATASELGQHQFKIMCVNEDGISVGLEAEGGFEMKEVGGASISFNLQLIFPKPGRYTFTVSVDRQEVDSYSFWVRTIPAPKMGGPR